ncbi:hypothetical protein MMC17_000006 [Xylographa soralifera]|nr:hypothetical protein [Xylographa soralifera]
MSTLSSQQSYALLKSQSKETGGDASSEKSGFISTFTDDSEECLLEGPKNTRHDFRIITVALIFFALSILLSIFSIICVVRGDKNIDNKFLRRTSYYSPILNDLSIPLTTTRLNGSFLNTSPPSIYRQPPSPAVDAAWERISLTRTIPISSADVLRVGKNPLKTAKFPLSHNLGPDAYVAQIDVFHQIHCLNILRKELHFDYYYGSTYPAGRASEPAQQPMHVSHCLHILLQNLMCQASVDVVTHRWVDVQKHPIPDFSVRKVCRDFEAVLQHVEERSVEFMSIRRPLDAWVETAPDVFRDLFFQWEYEANDVLHPGGYDS